MGGAASIDNFDVKEFMKGPPLPQETMFENASELGIKKGKIGGEDVVLGWSYFFNETTKSSL